MNRITLLFCIVATGNAFLTQIVTGQSDWRLWRGPHCNGVAVGSEVFDDSGFQLDLLWKNKIGSAYSSMTIANNRVFTMFAQGDSDMLGAFDLKTGEALWDFRLGQMYKAHDGGHDGPVSTPVVDDETVYALDPRGRLVAVDAENGKLRWSQNIREQFAGQVPFWGFAATPIVKGERLVVQVGGSQGNGIVGFDKSTGKQKWKVPSGRAEYRSPIAVEYNGKQCVVFSDDSKTECLDIFDGAVQWTYGSGISNDKSPLAIGNDQFLLIRRGRCELIQANPGRKPKRIWTSNEFDGNYDVPVFQKGFLYGFTGDFLTCVDASNGQRIWRSRPPGGKSIIAVDGHLVILGSKGDVVVARATPDGYQEKARRNVSIAASYQSPAFANQTIVVRNLKEMVALRPSRSKQPRLANPRPVGTMLKLANRLQSTPKKDSVIDEFLREQDSFPIIENGMVHFVYRGKVTDLAVRGSMLPNGEEDSLFQLPGTDLYYRSYPIEPKARWEYQFVKNYTQSVPDTLNRQRAIGNDSFSELVMPGRTIPKFCSPYEGDNPGKLTSLSVNGVGKLDVYLPNEYKPGRAHPLVLVLAGNNWIVKKDAKNILDQLGDENESTPIVAFIPQLGERELGGAGTRRFADRLATQILPELQDRLRIQNGASSVTLLGIRGGAVAATYAALKFPERFNHCFAISYGRADTVRADQISELLNSGSESKPSFYVTWNRYDARRPQSFDCRTQSQQLKNSLAEKGYAVEGGEFPESAGWGSWRIQFGRALQQHYSDK